MFAVKKKYTYADYAALPEDKRYQLINGEIIEMPSPSTLHQRIVGRIFQGLANYADKTGLGEVFIAPLDCYFSEHETFQPDIIFVSAENLHRVKEKRIEGPPDLVVEVISKSTAYYDLRHKKEVYESSGVKEYWIVDPMEEVAEILSLPAAALSPGKKVKFNESIESGLLPGFKLLLTA